MTKKVMRSSRLKVNTQYNDQKGNEVMNTQYNDQKGNEKQ